MKFKDYCRHNYRNALLYLEDELGLAEQRAIEKHLNHCLPCRGELRFSRGVIELLRYSTDLDVPRPVASRFEHFIDRLAIGEDG